MINRNYKILVIDDKPEHIDVLRSLLSDVFPNVDVLAAITCRQALDYAAAGDCDMILLDFDLFAADEGEICRNLKKMETTKNIPLVLLIPRDADRQSRLHAIECGIDVFLVKPIDDCELEAQVRAILRYKSLSDEMSESAKAVEDFATRFHSLFENMSSGVAIFKVINDGSSGKDYIFADCNEAALKMEHLEKSKIIGKSLYDVRPYADLGFAVQYFKKVWETGEAVEFETKSRIDATHYAWYETKVIKLASGEIATFYDNVSVAMNSTQKLVESEKKYRTIAENMTDVIWTTDMELHTTYISPSIEKLIGVSPEIYMSWPLTDRFTPQSLELLMKLYNTEMELEKKPYQSDRKINTIETQLYLPNKEVVWVSMNLTFIRDENKKAIGILGVTRDITERKIAEKEIYISETKFKHVFDHSAIGKSLTLPNGELHVNRKLCEMLGYTEEELVGKKWQDISVPEDFDVTQTAMDNLLSGRKSSEHFEKRYIKKDGSILWAEVHSSIRLDEKGQPLYFMTSIIDITDRKRFEDELKESENRYKSLFENSGIGIAVFSPEGRILSFNQKAAQNMGGKAEDFIGKLFAELFPQAAEEYLLRVTRCIESGLPMVYEDLVQLKTGPRWFSSSYNKVTDTKGNLIGAHVASLDITERKNAENDLNESQAVLNAALETSEAGIMIVDAPDGKIRYVNKAGLFLKNRSAINQPDQSATNLHIKRWDIHRPDGTKYGVGEDPLSRAIQRGETCSEEFVLRKGEEDERYVWAKSAPIRDSQGIVTAGIGVFIDVTDRKKIEDEIRRQNDLFTTLLKLLPVGVFMVDSPSGKPLIANDAALHILGRGILPDANAENLSHTYKARKRDASEDYPLEEMPIILGMQGKASHIDDMVVERPDGTETLLEIFGTPVRNDKGDIWASLVTFLDITKRKHAEENLIYLSYHDFLTGLYNRRFFEEELKRLDTERNLPITIVMADLNGLKLINDSFGHATGDELLKKAARVIKEVFRSDDLVSRIGGDEYAIMLVKTDATEAAQIIQRLNQRTSSENTGVLDLSISFGYHTKTNKHENILKIMENAENHMYRQKFYERDSVRSKTVEIIMNTLFEKSNREMMHSRRVSEICEAIATELHLEKANINKIRTAGLVHDIGKIGISENILNKPKKLTEIEWDEIKKHPESGWRILISVKEFSEIADFVLGHHEHWDGSGYPNGLKGIQISLEARIIALADAYDAMTVDRTYRKGLTPQEAITEIKRCSGTQFDPDLANLFINKVVMSLKKKA